MKPRMSIITLGVGDLDKAITFYQQGLGFPRYGDHDDIAFFELNGTWLALYDRQGLAADAGVSSEGTGFNSFAIAHNVHSPDEVDAVIQQAAAAGATIVKEPQTASWGGYSAYFKDPDGHLWEIAHNPFSWLGPKDEAE